MTSQVSPETGDCMCKLAYGLYIAAPRTREEAGIQVVAFAATGATIGGVGGFVSTNGPGALAGIVAGGFIGGMVGITKVGIQLAAREVKQTVGKMKQRVPRRKNRI